MAAAWLALPPAATGHGWPRLATAAHCCPGRREPALHRRRKVGLAGSVVLQTGRELVPDSADSPLHCLRGRHHQLRCAPPRSGLPTHRSAGAWELGAACIGGVAVAASHGPGPGCRARAGLCSLHAPPRPAPDDASVEISISARTGGIHEISREACQHGQHGQHLAGRLAGKQPSGRSIRARNSAGTMIRRTRREDDLHAGARVSSSSQLAARQSAVSSMADEFLTCRQPRAPNH